MSNHQNVVYEHSFAANLNECSHKEKQTASETISNYESCPFIAEEPRLRWDQVKRDTNSIFVRMKWNGSMEERGRK